jgi:ABC-type multidrug transport system fused ATPase/permease subunit
MCSTKLLLLLLQLADGNSVSEAAIGSMPTVRAFGAEGNELKEFETCMKSYLSMNLRASIAYFGYATCVTALPQLVIALVLFYGGLLVRSQGSDHITSGQLVSFLLYLSSLSDAFNSIGSIFASLTAAVGAADKVFELIHRSPKIAPPALNATSVPTDNDSSIDSHEAFGIVARRTTEHHKRGLHPDSCVGEVCLTNVNMFYPARPTRQILNGLTLKAPPGAVIALVGKSGGGKSSIISLVQHLYEPSSGVVSIDGHKVRSAAIDHVMILF